MENSGDYLPEMPGYRLLTLKSVIPLNEGQMLDLRFEESIIGLGIETEILFQKTGVKQLSAGDQIFIKGKYGNDDGSLLGRDSDTEIDFKLP